MQSYEEVHKMTQNTNLPPQEREAISEGCEAGDFKRVRRGTSPEFAEMLDDQNIESFLQMMTLRGSESPQCLIEMANVLRQYTAKEREERLYLNAKERQILRIGINYLEQWMYAGGIANLPELERDGIDPSKTLASTAFLVNQLARITGQERYKSIGSFDTEKISSFVRDTESFGVDYLNNQIEGDLALRKGELANIELALKENVGEGKRLGMDDLLRKKELLEIGIDNLEHLISARDQIKEYLHNQADDVVKDMVECVDSNRRRSGPMYILKNILMGAEILRRSEDHDKRRFIPDFETVNFTQHNGEYVFSFIEDDRSDTPSYYKFHFKVDYMVWAIFAAEYLFRKYDSEAPRISQNS
ncbi:MAG: hypothetical protein V4469_02955 [Patescibacteria group bacterium]